MTGYPIGAGTGPSPRSSHGPTRSCIDRATAKRNLATVDSNKDRLMLFCVKMAVKIPHDTDKDMIATVKYAEKLHAKELQEKGILLHLWRIVGRYENISIFDVPDNDSLHDILSTLPLFPWLDIEVTPLARHPSAI
jgi:muconolactone D-isomerase